MTSALDARFTLKGTGAFYGPDRTFDTEHIRLTVELDIQRETLRGRAQTTLRAMADNVKEMVFNAVNFRLRAVKWNSRAVSYQYKDGKISITAPKPSRAGERVVVDIEYEVAKPKLGLYFIKPDKQYPNKPVQVWTQGEDEYSRYWFPCHDAPHDRTTTEIIATVPTGFTAVSNGQLMKTSRSKGRATFHWSQKIPHATYLVTLTAGQFSEIKDTWRGKPVTYYCEKGREEEARRAFSKTPKMLEFFSKSIGTAYPYAKYAQVAVTDFIYGGMENTSATTQTDTALLDERAALDYSSDELVAHELAHQWFGDYLTCKEWSHAWLNESFATYFDALFKRFDKGQEEYLYAIRRNAEEYFHEDKERYRRAIVTRMFRRPTDLFDRHLYEKGSVVLFMLHQQLGEKLFWKSIGLYVKRNAGKVVQTTDLINAIEEATGRNMARFFDEWVYGAGHPEYKVRTWWDERKKEIVVRVVQTNADGGTIFHVNTELAFHTSQGEKRLKIELNAKSHLFRQKLASRPSLVLFDPDHALLMKADFPKPERMLNEQLFRDKNVLGRIDAAHALARVGGREALESLRRAIQQDSFWGVSAEAALALGSMRSEDAALALVHCLDTVENLKVRRAIYSALRHFKSQEIAMEVERRFRKEASYFAEAEAYRLLGATHPRAADILQSALRKDSWNEILRSAALEGLAATKSPQWIDVLLSYTKWGVPHRLRMAAVRSLAEYGIGDDRIQQRMIELTQDKFLLVQISAVRVLQSIGDERAVPALKKLTKGDLDGRVMRLAEEAIAKITKGFES